MMQAPLPEQELGIGRVEALSDGVFAVAVTLLVLNIQVPHISESADASVLIDALLRQWPTYLGYVVTFITLGSVWIGHHRMLRFLHRTDDTFQILNVLYLMFITLTPFTTAFFAEYLQQPNKIRIGTTIFGVQWTIMGFVFSTMWRYARRAGFLKPGVDPARIQQLTVGFGVGSVLGFFAMLVALVIPPLGVALYVAISLAYLRPLLRVFQRTY